mmetsp:Transcript_30708/g.99898  ORF Transcript_30708/g.99898 Transcript_30708/m.99898 type:complete len:543 (+) Transcript_30708:833-2461(+)
MLDRIVPMLHGRWRSATFSSTSLSSQSNIVSVASPPSDDGFMSARAAGATFPFFHPLSVAVDLAERSEGEAGPSVTTVYLRFKIALMLRQEHAAMEHLEQLTKSGDFDLDFMILAALESQEAAAYRCAGKALLAMHSEVARRGESNLAGYEGNILRNAIAVCQKWQAQCSAAGNTESGSIAGGAVPHIAELMELARLRLGQVGATRFFGVDEAAAAAPEGAASSSSFGSAAARWFACTAWNLALEETTSERWATAGQLFSAAATFFPACGGSGGGSGGAGDTKETLKLAHLLAVVTSLEAFEANRSSVHELERAEKHLKAWKEASSALSATGTKRSSSDKMQLYLHMLEFTLRLFQKDAARLSKILDACQGFAEAGGEETILRLAYSALKHNDGSAELTAVTKQALLLALRVLLAKASPDIKVASEVIRRVVEVLHAEDQELLRVFAEAAGILRNTSAGEYPREEAAWLVAKAWNKGVSLSKLQSYDDAVEFMRAGLSLVDVGVAHNASLDENKARMQKECAEVERRIRTSTTPDTAMPDAA